MDSGQLISAISDAAAVKSNKGLLFLDWDNFLVNALLTDVVSKLLFQVANLIRLVHNGPWHSGSRRQEPTLGALRGGWFDLSHLGRAKSEFCDPVLRPR